MTQRAQSVLDAARIERYRDALRNLPPSGGGGCHAALLGVANLGRLARSSREQVARDLAAHVHGTRKVTPREIEDAVNKAFDFEYAKHQHADGNAAPRRGRREAAE